MAAKKGDFILVNYVCKVKETGEVVESTTGEEHGHEEEHVHEPLLVVVGEGWVPRGLDEALEGVEVGQKFEVEVPPSKGFGERDQSKVRLLPLRRFIREGVNPMPGMQVQVNGRPAIVRSVGAGRVQVDFNHPLAGKTLLYEVKVEKALRTRAEKVKALIHRRLPSIDLDKLGLKVTPKEVAVELPEESFFLEGLQLAKRQVASDIQKYIPGIVEVSFTEKFRKAEASSEQPQGQGSTPQGSESPP
ncbi:MAG: FKBP-type peptidyl-prolyl cis-trans isomerase [Candidatus Bathyarchaeia archaeon]